MSTPENSLPPEPPPESSGGMPALAEPQPPAAQFPEDLRAPWGWLDLLIFFFFGVGSLILMSNVAAVLILILLNTSPTEYEKHPTALAAHATLAQAMWSMVVMMFLFALLRVRFAAPFWRTMGWRDLRLPGANRFASYLLCFFGGSVFAILINLASGFVPTEKKLPIQDLFQTRVSVMLVAATAILIAPLVEETIFRGFLYPVLARSLGISAGVILTGVLFGLMHAMQLSGGYGQIGLLMVVGIVLTYVRARTGTVLAPYLLHLGYNTLLFVAFFFATGGLRDLPKLP